MTDSLGAFVLIRALFVIVIVLIWGVISTSWITVKALTVLTAVEEKVLGNPLPRHVSSFWGFLIAFVVVIGINGPALLLIMNFSFWLVDQIH